MKRWHLIGACLAIAAWAGIRGIDSMGAVSQATETARAVTSEVSAVTRQSKPAESQAEGALVRLSIRVEETRASAPPPVPRVKPKSSSVIASNAKAALAPKPVRQEPETYTADAGLTEKGIALIGSRGEKLSGFPSIRAEYGGMSFNGYFERMTQLGCGFFVWSAGEGRAVGRIDLATGTLSAPGSFDGFSPRSRDILSEPGLERFISMAMERHGSGGYRVVLLMPVAIDAAIVSAVEQEARRIGKDIRDAELVTGRYVPSSSGMLLLIEGARTPSGDSWPIRCRILL